MKKPTMGYVLLKPEKTLKEYNLCENCFSRLFSKKPKKMKKNQSKCYICKNMFSELKFHINKMLQVSSDFQFSTFVTGAILKPSYIDRDDSIRSKYQLQGVDSLKTELTREVSKKFKKKTNKKIDFQNPDVTFTLNFKTDSCEISSKPVFLFGRYTKKIRNLSQKQKPCENCDGKGCASCNQHGISKFDSVEGKICEYLFQKFSARQAKTTWIGGEDKKSLVLGKGRPFFVKLVNPKKRKIRAPNKINLREIAISNLKVIEQIPREPIHFKSKIEIKILSGNKINPLILKNLKSIKKTPILVREKPGKEAKKTVYELSYKKTSSNSFRLKLTVDSGLPVKRFVEGNSVSPNISQILDLQCKCKEFDFHDIEL